MRKVLPIILAALMCCFCRPDPIDEHLVIDGWIDDGGFPVVIVTSSLPVTQRSWTIDDIGGHVLHLATVNVSDGENSVTLTGMKNDNYFPPYIYTTTHIRGEAGKTYSLTVRYGKTEATATTTIPAPQALTAISAVPEGGGYAVRCSFTPAAGSYYTFFSRREGVDKMYLPSFLSLVDGDAAAAPVEVGVLRGIDVNSDTGYPSPFGAGDQVSVRFCVCDEVTYDFWRGYEESWLLTHNPFVPVNSGVHSNVSGGYGLWAGYGATTYTITAE